MPDPIHSRQEADDFTVHGRQPYWPPRPRSTDAPNVVFIVLDDCGFSQLGCYGSSIETPAIDGLAEKGLRYTNFHVTAMCSPTRASLLTGRNHHAAGMGYLADFDTGFDNARGAISLTTATLPEMLRQGGYGTYALGKWHLTPPSECSSVGPFQNWPTQRGFDRYYGFLGGEDDQYAPELWCDQHYAPVPDRDNYHLSEDLANKAIEFLSDHVTTTPDRPFFLYLAFGACHAPHQAPRSFIDRYRGRFDSGWDREREIVLERQESSGIVPPGTPLPPKNPDVTAWSDLPDEARNVLIRMQEVFAGFTEHTDAQIQRIVEFLERFGKMNNTLFVVMSDNGASGEGGEFGSENEYRYFLGLPDTLEENRQAFDRLGGPWAHNHYPSGWAQAGNTPLRMYKKYNYGGGVRAPLVVHWPDGIADQGGIRDQFHHAIDIVPSVLELAGITAPANYRGVEQEPIHGVSLAYTFGNAEAASRHSVQYFEMGGQRGIYRDGWKAVTLHRSGEAYGEDEWELFDLNSDYAETSNLAREQPERLREMVDLWWDQARRYNVLPLDDRAQARAFARDPAATARKNFRLLPGTRLLTPVSGPNFAMRPFTVEAHISEFVGNEEGVLLAYGRRAAGFTLFIKQRRLWFDYNLAGRHSVFASPQHLEAGISRVSAEVFQGRAGAQIRLLVGDECVLSKKLPMLFPAGFGLLSTQCGMNAPSPVSPEYAAPFRYDGLLHVDVTLGEDNGAAIAGLWEAAHRSQ